MILTPEQESLKQAALATDGAKWEAEGFEQTFGNGTFYGGLIMHANGHTIIAQQVLSPHAEFIAAANPAAILALLAQLEAVQEARVMGEAWKGMVPLSVDGEYVFLEGIGAVKLDYGQSVPAQSGSVQTPNYGASINAPYLEAERAQIKSAEPCPTCPIATPYGPAYCVKCAEAYLAEPSIQMPQGLAREEMRSFIVSHAKPADAPVDELAASGVRFFTAVYAIPKDMSGEVATELCERPYWTAGSWSHALDERDAARAALQWPVQHEPDSLDKLNAILRAEVDRIVAGAVPDRMQLVPMEPTEDMIVAFAEAWFGKVRCIDDCEMEDCYAAMLAAAPVAVPGEPQ